MVLLPFYYGKLHFSRANLGDADLMKCLFYNFIQFPIPQTPYSSVQLKKLLGRRHLKSQKTGF